jgi:hypothetical protein
MSITELQQQRYFIVLDALLKGIQLAYKNEWSIFYSNGQIYQTYYSKKRGEQVTHKSDITLQSFLDRFKKIENEELKRIFANAKLCALQEKLEGGNS